MKKKINPRIYLIVGVSLVVLFSTYFIFFKITPLISMVSGTEYISGEEGQIIVRLHDSKNNPLTNAECVVSLLYPDKSFFIIEMIFPILRN